MNLTLQKGLFIALALLSASAFASGLDTRRPYTHFYAGGTVGIASLADKESTNTPIHDIHYLGASGALGGLLVGYDVNPCNLWKVKLEGFINTTSLNLSDNQNYAPVTSYKVNMRYNAGVRILPGYELTPRTEGHLILGYSYGKFNISDNGNYGIINQDFSSNGFQAGVGLGALLLESVSIRTDVLYTIYSSQTSSGVTTASPSASQVYQNKLSTLEGDLTLIFNI